MSDTQQPAPDLEREVGKRVRALRTDRGLSQEVLGTLMGVSQPVIWKLEQGERPLRVNEAWALARIFRVPLAELLATDDDAIAKKFDRLLEDLRMARSDLATAAAALTSVRSNRDGLAERLATHEREADAVRGLLERMETVLAAAEDAHREAQRRVDALERELYGREES